MAEPKVVKFCTQCRLCLYQL